MIRSFRDSETEDIWNKRTTSKALRRLPRELWDIAARKLDMLNAAQAISDVTAPPSNRLEKLRADRSGQWSIRINKRYRICFRFDSGAYEVEIVDYH